VWVLGRGGAGGVPHRALNHDKQVGRHTCSHKHCCGAWLTWSPLSLPARPARHTPFPPPTPFFLHEIKKDCTRTRQSPQILCSRGGGAHGSH
jgi:hypothetical protein